MNSGGPEEVTEVRIEDIDKTSLGHEPDNYGPAERHQEPEKQMAAVIKAGLRMALESWCASNRPLEIAREFLAGDTLVVHPTLRFCANDVIAFRAALGLATPKNLHERAQRTESSLSPIRAGERK